MKGCIVLCGVFLAFSGCRDESSGVSGARRERAWAWFQQNEYHSALAEFAAWQAQAPSDPGVQQEALYARAKIWHLRPSPRKNLLLAESLYREALAIDAESDLAPWILMGLARTRILPVGGESVSVDARVAAYQELIDRFPRHPAGGEAFLLQQAALFELGTAEAFPGIRDSLKRFIEEQRESPWISHAWMMLASCAERLGDQELRLKAMLKAEEMRGTDPLGSMQDMSELYWSIATTAHYDLGDFALAREYYHRFIIEYPTQQRVFPAKQALEQMDRLEDRLREELRASPSGEVSR